MVDRRRCVAGQVDGWVTEWVHGGKGEGMSERRGRAATDPLVRAAHFKSEGQEPAPESPQERLLGTRRRGRN